MTRIASLAALLLSLTAAPALADYPERPITLIVPAAAGGNADITARLIGQEMARVLGQAVVVENRVGAGGRIGTQALVRAPADGYTIGYAHVGTLVLHRYLFKQQLYDLDRDIAPVGLVAETPNVIVVNAASPYPDLKSFIDASRAQPDRLTMTSADPGTTSEVGVKLFIAQTGAAVRQIPYKATAAQLADLLGGHVDSMMENLPPPHRQPEGWPPARPGRNHQAPRRLQSGRADRGRAGLPGLRAIGLERAGGAGRHPARRHRAVERRHEHGAAFGSRRPRTAQPLAGTAGRHARRRQDPDSKGTAQMGKHHQGSRHHAGLMTARPHAGDAPWPR